MLMTVKQDVALRRALRRDRIIRGRSAVIDAQRADWRKFINRSQSEAQETVDYLDGIPARRAQRTAGAILRTIVIKNSSGAAGTHVAVSPALIPPVRVVDVAVILQSSVITESGMFWSLYLSSSPDQAVATSGDVHLFDMVHQVNGAPQAGELPGELASWPHDSGGAPLRVNRVFAPGLSYIKHAIRNVAVVVAAFFIELTVVENDSGGYEDELLPVGGIARSRVSRSAAPRLANLSPAAANGFMRMSAALQRVANQPVAPGRAPSFTYATNKWDPQPPEWWATDPRMPHAIYDIDVREGQDSIIYTFYEALPGEAAARWNIATGQYEYMPAVGESMPSVELGLVEAMTGPEEV